MARTPTPAAVLIILFLSTGSTVTPLSRTCGRMISPHGVFTSYQVNVDADGNNIVCDAANEPCITMDPNNLVRIAIGWRQFDAWQSNFRQAALALRSTAA